MMIGSYEPPYIMTTSWHMGLEAYLCSDDRWDGEAWSHHSWVDFYSGGEKVACGIPSPTGCSIRGPVNNLLDNATLCHV